MKRFYAFMLAMVLIVSSFVFSACSSQDGGTDAGNGTASNQTQQNENGSTTDNNKADDTNTNEGNNTSGNNAAGNDNVVEEIGDDVARTVDDVVDAGQR